MRDARSPIDGIVSPFGALMGSAALIPISLFANSEPGVWYDPLDLTTLFQDAAGTTPVTAAAQPDGLTMDKSRGLVLGPELVTNGTFDTNVSGWVSGTTTSTAAAVGGEMQVTAVSNAGRQVTAISTTIGKSYKVSGLGRYISGSGSPAAALYQTSSTGSTITAGTINPTLENAPLGLIFVATATTSYISAIALGSAGTVAAFDNISVKEIPGIHASQASATFKPAYQTTPQRLQFDGSDDRLPFAYNPTASGSLAVRINGTTASRVVMGSQAATDGRAFIGLAADGSLGAGIGAQSTSTIKGATDIRGVWTTGVVTWDGTTVRLYQNGVEVYSGAQSGAVNTTVPMRVGCLNSNGTDGAFWAGGIGAAIALGRVMTPAEISSLHTLWSTIQ